MVVSDLRRLLDEAATDSRTCGKARARAVAILPGVLGKDYTYLGCDRFENSRYCRRPIGQSEGLFKEEFGCGAHTGKCKSTGQQFYRLIVRIQDDSGHQLDALAWQAGCYLLGDDLPNKGFVRPLWGKDFADLSSVGKGDLIRRKIDEVRNFELDFCLGEWTIIKVTRPAGKATKPADSLASSLDSLPIAPDQNRRRTAQKPIAVQAESSRATPVVPPPPWAKDREVNTAILRKTGDEGSSSTPSQPLAVKYATKQTRSRSTQRPPKAVHFAANPAKASTLSTVADDSNQTRAVLKQSVADTLHLKERGTPHDHLNSKDETGEATNVNAAEEAAVRAGGLSCDEVSALLKVLQRVQTAVKQLEAILGEIKERLRG